MIFLKSLWCRKLIYGNYLLIIFYVYFGLFFRIWSILCYVRMKVFLFLLEELKKFLFVFVLGGFIGLFNLVCGICYVNFFYLFIIYVLRYEVYNCILFWCRVFICFWIIIEWILKGNKVVE